MVHRLNRTNPESSSQGGFKARSICFESFPGKDCYTCDYCKRKSHLILELTLPKIGSMLVQKLEIIRIPQFRFVLTLLMFRLKSSSFDSMPFYLRDVLHSMLFLKEILELHILCYKRECFFCMSILLLAVIFITGNGVGVIDIHWHTHCLKSGSATGPVTVGARPTLPVKVIFVARQRFSWWKMGYKSYSL